MPNVNAPFGLRCLMQTLDGGCPVIAEFQKAPSYATALFIGDAVNQVADATIQASATPGTTYYTGVNLNYGAASKQTSHLVIVSPAAVYVAQANGVLDAVDRGLNANLALGAGNANTGISGHTINASSKNTTASLDVKLLDLLDTPDNEYGQYAKFVVVFNKHRYHGGVAGV